MESNSNTLVKIEIISVLKKLLGFLVTNIFNVEQLITNK